jgi:hypothetical protein
MAEAPVITRGAFDSQNLAFWDPTAGILPTVQKLVQAGFVRHGIAPYPYATGNRLPDARCKADGTAQHRPLLVQSVTAGVPVA